jgi:hypothetical protein
MPQCQTGKRPGLGPPKQIQIYFNTMKMYTLLVKKTVEWGTDFQKKYLGKNVFLNSSGKITMNCHNCLVAWLPGCMFA